MEDYKKVMVSAAIRDLLTESEVCCRSYPNSLWVMDRLTPAKIGRITLDRIASTLKNAAAAIAAPPDQSIS